MSQDSGAGQPPDPTGQPGPGPYGQGQPGQYGQNQPGQYGQGQYGPGPGQAPPPPGYYGGIPSAPQAPGGMGGMSSTEQNSLGVWSLVLGIASLICLGFLAGIPAIILGRKAKQAEAAGRANNGSLGTAGQVMGWISVAVTVLGILWVVLMVATGGWAAFMEAIEEGANAGY